MINTHPSTFIGSMLSAWQLMEVSDYYNNYREEPDIFHELNFENIFESFGIVEVYGQSGAGKSTLALQYVVSMLCSHQYMKALYVCTEGQFSIKRLLSLCQARGLEDDAAEPLMQRLFIQHLGDIETQEHFLCYFLDPLIDTNSIGILVIDTISANFRSRERDQDSTLSLYSMSHALNRLSTEHRIRILCLNQVTDLPAGAQSIDNVGTYRAALGHSWTTCVNSQIHIFRHDSNSDLRSIVVQRCPTLKPKAVKARLSALGFYLS